VVSTAVPNDRLSQGFYFFVYPHEAEWTPFQTHFFTENLIVLEIEAPNLWDCSEEL
jgi:hypothetical protein